jgi:hypothetical protein
MLLTRLLGLLGGLVALLVVVGVAAIVMSQ